MTSKRFVEATLVQLLLAFPAFAAGDNNELRVSARTNALGTGTVHGSGAIQDPFWGDLDSIITSIPPSSTIHLLPGVHCTKGILNLRANQKVKGAGMDVTIVRQDNRFNKTTDGALLNSYDDGVEISDLTLDCAMTGNEPYRKGGARAARQSGSGAASKSHQCERELGAGKGIFSYARWEAREERDRGGGLRGILVPARP